MTRIRFEDLPSTNTPRNAENLNKLNNVVISPTEPTTGEEVWLQIGENLFDKNNYNLFKGWMSEVNLNFTANNSGYLVYVPCEPNTDYIVTRTVLENNFQVGSGSIAPVSGGKITQVFVAGLSDRIVIKTSDNDSYLYMYVKYEGDSVYTLEQILDSLKIELVKKIYIKNDNDEYEEFYNENAIKRREIVLLNKAKGLSYREIGEFVEIYLNCWEATTVNAYETVEFGKLPSHLAPMRGVTTPIYSKTSQNKVNNLVYLDIKEDGKVCITNASDTNITWYYAGGHTMFSIK